MRTLRVLSRLLAYPQVELQEQMNALKDVLIQDGFLKKKTLIKLSVFMDELGNADLMDAQENYVEIFDRGRAHCLHLFEHVHGESRFRGQAMLDLSKRYALKGLEIGVGELPDYLPLFLEYISICEPREGQKILTQAAPVIATIGEKLRRNNSGYTHVLSAIVELSGARIKPSDIQEPEAFAKFGENTPDCGTCDPTPLRRASRQASQGVEQ